MKPIITSRIVTRKRLSGWVLSIAAARICSVTATRNGGDGTSVTPAQCADAAVLVEFILLVMRALGPLAVLSDDDSTTSLLPPSPQCPIQLDQAAKFVTSCARQSKFGSVKRSLTVQSLQV